MTDKVETNETPKDESVTFPIIKKRILNPNLLHIRPQFEISPYAKHRLCESIEDIRKSFVVVDNDEEKRKKNRLIRKPKLNKRSKRIDSFNEYKLKSFYIELYEKNMKSPR